MRLGHQRTALLILLLMIFLIYGNTFSSSWHLDDLQNILANKYLHLNHIDLKNLWQAAHANPMHPGTLYRPVACISLAINWYFGKSHVFGYHLVNILIHVLTAFFLYLFVLELFETPNGSGRCKGHHHDVALLASLLWAISPIQTQAITYIVQRMACMAAMFYVLGMLFYLKARLSLSNKKRVCWGVLCFFSFLLAIGSKENALMFPFALILIEITFFQGLRISKKNLIYLGAGLSLAILIIFGGYFIIKHNNPLAFINGYGNRPFTLKQRLLSEPRVMVLYLSQIFIPSSRSLSITHDFNISTSLFSPWSTFPAILFVLLLVSFGFYQTHKRPFLSFAIIFFFLNHIIESSVVPLELIFEHRNYLPSLFLFVPIAIGIESIVVKYSRKFSFMSAFTFTAIVLLVASIGISTLTRNMAWASEKSLWQDAMQKAPESARPLQNLATGYYYKTGALAKSFGLYKAALEKRGNYKNYKASLYYNLGLICSEKGMFRQAINYFKKGLQLTPKASKFYYHISSSYLMLGKLEKALKTVDIPICHGAENLDCLYLKGLILLKMDRPSDAVPLFRKIIRMTTSQDKDNRLSWSGLGSAMNLLEKPLIAERFFKQAYRMDPKNIAVILGLIEASVRQKDGPGAKKYTDDLFSLATGQRIVAILNSTGNENLNMPFNRQLIGPVIAEKLAENAKKIRKISGQSS